MVLKARVSESRKGDTDHCVWLHPCVLHPRSRDCLLGMGKTNIDEIFFGESIDADAIRAKMTCYSASDDAHDVVGQRHQVSRPDKAANKKLELAAKTTATQLLHTYATEAENLGCKPDELLAIPAEPRKAAKQALLEFTETAKPDFLVCGSRGMGAVARVFLGSVSDFLLHNAPCSVLIVRVEVDEGNLTEGKAISAAEGSSSKKTNVKKTKEEADVVAVASAVSDDAKA
uniref:UspA domain-containing protein n=1 Tax=Lotharella globosa TaxID=91324 RepID=A0A7S3YEQ2_9EUKA|mmetsp:Transcript_25683/g.50275  ORF Transcript_25683/g.50275 Transcript_25683/m.50275 type:complete len:230 (+) Transcript_25683:244-933(+)